MTVANGLKDAAAAGTCHLTILEKKDHVDLCTPHSRSMVNEVFADEVLLKHERALLGSAKPEVIYVKSIVEVLQGKILYTTPGGKNASLPADAIVVATGTSYKGAYIKNDDGLHKGEWLQKLKV